VTNASIAQIARERKAKNSLIEHASALSMQVRLTKAWAYPKPASAIEAIAQMGRRDCVGFLDNASM
jgi:hypothetical protein